MLRPVWALVVAIAGALSIALSPLEAAAPTRDYASEAWTVLPPGENGSLTFDRNTRDQAALYDGLTALRGRVTAADLRRYFKSAPLGRAIAKPKKLERPRSGVTIVRDSFGVAHVTGRTEADVAFGAGWVTAADRGLLLQQLRGPARLAALDVRGVDPLQLAFSGGTFTPSADAEAFLANQLDALRAQGSVGRRISSIIDWYAAGINAWYRANRVRAPLFTPADVVACIALFSARYGENGGQEAANSMFLDALLSRFGEAQGRAVFADLRQASDPETPVTVPGTFSDALPSQSAPGSVVLDDGSYRGAPLDQPAAGSSAIVVGRGRSETRRPILVGGPQVGFYFPPLLAEIELSGAGFAARGAMFPGVPFVLVGRGPDFAWTTTSSQADAVDLFVETLCPDEREYLYRGGCEPMRRVVAGTLERPGQPDQTVSYLQTTHGPVVGLATVDGRRVAISLQRATRGRELLGTRAFYELDTARVTSAARFLRTAGVSELALNWFYADEKDIAFVSGGRLPRRAPGIDPALPTVGTGDYDWRGFLTFAQHPRALNPPSGLLVNWNNRPAAGVGAADSNFARGSVHRVELLRAALAAQRKHTPAGVVGVMNAAATQDLRVMEVWPVVRAVLRTGAAPSARAEDAAGLVDRWRAAGGSRIDADLDGGIDDPGAAVLDAAWPLVEEAVLGPTLGPLLPRLASLNPRNDTPRPTGSAFLYGWHGYVEKDLRAVLGEPVTAPFSRRYCGGGDVAPCRESLWAAVASAAATLTREQGSDPAGWRAPATRERIRFVPGLLPDTMRWTNRPTFQQVMSFSGHRRR